METLSILLVIVVVILIAYIVYLRRERSLIKREADVMFEKRRMEIEDQVRNETLEKSRAILKGKIAEQFVPFLKDFKYNPSDARFIGSPIDYIIFDGYTDVKDKKSDRPITVVLMDIKTGKSADLTAEQKKIKEAVEQKRVKWKTIHLEVPPKDGQHSLEEVIASGVEGKQSLPPAVQQTGRIKDAD